MTAKNHGHILTKTPVVCLLALFCCFLWGSAFPGIKTGYRLMHIATGETASQIFYAGLRFTLAGILVILAGSVSARKFLLPERKTIPKILLLAAFQTYGQYLFFYVGLAHAPGVRASILEGVSSFVAILFAACVFRMEKLTGRKIIGCLLGFAGVVIISFAPAASSAGFSFNGEGFILISTVMYALSSAMIKLFSEREDPVLLSGWQFLTGGVALTLSGMAAGGRIGNFTGQGAILLLYLAFLSAAAYTVWGVLLKYNPVSKVTIFGFANPVFGALLSAAVLEEGSFLSGRSVAALTLVCAGIAVVNAPKNSRI